MKQTAVEWLVNVVQSCIAPDYIPKEIINQAKAMEKEQIIDTYFEGKNDGILMERYSDYEHTTPEQYYNETFKSE